MTIDLRKEKKAAEEYIRLLTNKDKYIQGESTGATQGVKPSQTTKQPQQKTQPKQTPMEKLTAYLQSIGKQ
jgi:hypothetical protein